MCQRLGSCRQCRMSPANFPPCSCSLQTGSTVQPLVAVNEPVLVLVPASELATPVRGLKQAGVGPSTVGAPVVAPAVVELPSVFAPATELLAEARRGLKQAGEAPSTVRVPVVTPIVVEVPSAELMADTRRGLKQVRRRGCCLPLAASRLGRAGWVGQAPPSCLSLWLPAGSPCPPHSLTTTPSPLVPCRPRPPALHPPSWLRAPSQPPKLLLLVPLRLPCAHPSWQSPLPPRPSAAAAGSRSRCVACLPACLPAAHPPVNQHVFRHAGMLPGRQLAHHFPRALWARLAFCCPSCFQYKSAPPPSCLALVCRP